MRTANLSSPRHPLSRALGAAFAASFVGTPAAAQDSPQPAHPFAYEVRAHAAMNPGSLYLQGAVSYRHALYEANEPLLAHNEWSIQVGAGVSPASFRPSIRLALQPLSVLRLWLGYEGEGFFGGASGFARSFPSPSADYGRGLFSPPPDGPAGATGAYSLWVNKLELGARPQIQVGPWLARSSWRAVRYDASLRGGDRVFYDPWVDNVVYAHGWAVQSDTDVAYAMGSGGASSGALLGARFSLNLVFYPSDAYAPGEAQSNSNSPSARVGPWVRWPLLTPDRTRSVDELYVTGTTQFYVVDRFHTGATTPAAVPFVSLSLTATGDL